MATKKIYNRLARLLIGAAILIPLSAQAEFSLNHQIGAAYDALQPNGMQSVHTETQIMYAKPGEWVYLYRPERSSFVSYVRWYNYDTDRAIPKLYSTGESPTGSAATRIESTWAKDTTQNKFKAYNAYGWFAYNYASDRVTTADADYIEIKYRMHLGDSIYRIACDQSIWLDNFTWNGSGATTEPTLSKRIIYEIHPASEMAAMMEPYKDMDGTNEQFLEEYDMIAPTGRQLYIGPEYMYHTKTVTLKQYKCNARSNYYYINSQGNVTAASTNNKWKWYKDGVEDPTIVLAGTAAQFAPVSSNTADTVVYELKYNSATGVYFNVARFRVTYMDKNIVGPALSLPSMPQNLDMIYEQTFNFEKPNKTDFAFWLGHMDVDESTYGYYNKNLDGSPSYRKVRKGNITWSEYAITNRKQVWVDSGTAPQVYQHVDSTENIANNAKEGYMLYCDGSQQPGQVFYLKVSADLCPGATMYFSAWLCDASSEKNGSNGRSAPNMDFIVVGVDELGNEHALTTFTTGEFGINAPADLSNGSWSTTNRMARAKWHQIMFPVKFTAETTYPSYRLRIMNKSTSSDGNDFAIDDIRIYVQKPPVVPIQASTYDCPAGTTDSITAYLRVDYQAIDESSTKFYYQWRDEYNNPVSSEYYNIEGASTTVGCVQIPATEEAIIAAGDTCSSLLSFDAKYYNTEVPVVKYIKEQVDNGLERYIMYIAQPLMVRTNFTYTGFVTIRESDLGDKSGCGTFAELMIAGGTRITIDGVARGDSVIGLCSNRSYTLDIEMTYVEQNSTTGVMEEHATPCRADWLIGDSTYVNTNPEVYKYSFEQIERAVVDYRTMDPLTESVTIVTYLHKQGLLVPDTSTITVQPAGESGFTAFTIDGSAENGMDVCLTPRFLYINPSTPAVNMIMVGDISESLPAAIADRPRVVRIPNAQKNQGEFMLKTYIKGDTEVEYKVDTVILVSSTNPSWSPIGLSATSSTTVMAVEDSIRIYGASLGTLQAGYDYTFHVLFKDEDEGCERGFTYFTLRIVPDEVTWYGGAWNVDASWSAFVPMAETNVVLQPNTDYNVTFSTTDSIYDLNYTRNQCNHIYLPYDASLAGQEKIQINGKAFIDIKEYAWKWTLTSIPIHGAVSGDLFVSASESTQPFVVAPINQTVGEPADDRYLFEVYNSEYDASADKWKSATKSLVRPLVAGEACMVGIDCDNDNVNPIIRLPKQDNVYRYYDIKTYTWMSEGEYVERDANYGKLVYTGNNLLPLKELCEQVYLFGNPTLAYVDITKLVEDNSDKLTGRYYLESTGASKAPSKTEMTTFNRNVYTDEYHVLLPPYRGILLEGKASSQALTINVSSPLINPLGRKPLKRQTNGGEVATGIENTSPDATDGRMTVYDISGRLMGYGLDNLPAGIYIIREGMNSRKVMIR